MSLTNMSVYDYIMNKAPNISKKWFDIKDGEEGSIYSKQTSHSVENLLLQQHAFTIETVISAFLEDKKSFSNNLNRWASEVAFSRVQLGTPVHEVLSALCITRQLIWEYIEKFAQEQKDVTTENILQWSSIFHLTFDQLNNEFARMYHEFNRKKLLQQQELIKELGIPVIPITGNIGILPLIGHIDDVRAEIIIEQVPARCLNEQIKHLFIDLSGISIVDTLVLNELMKLIHVLQYTGIKSTLSGMRPEMAQIIHSLGIKLDNISTFSTLKHALIKLSKDVK